MIILNIYDPELNKTVFSVLVTLFVKKNPHIRKGFGANIKLCMMSIHTNHSPDLSALYQWAVTVALIIDGPPGDVRLPCDKRRP